MASFVLHAIFILVVTINRPITSSNMNKETAIIIEIQSTQSASNKSMASVIDQNQTTKPEPNSPTVNKVNKKSVQKKKIIPVPPQQHDEPPPPINLAQPSKYKVEGQVGGFSTSEGPPPTIDLGPEKIYASDTLSSPAKLISKIQASRTLEARKNGYTGTAEVELTISSQGGVINAVLKNNLDYGLNEVAIGIAKHLIFKPAQYNNLNVATMILLKIKFTNSD